MRKQYDNLMICSNQNDLILDKIISQLPMDNMEHHKDSLLNNKRKFEKEISQNVANTETELRKSIIILKFRKFRREKCVVFQEFE